MRRLTPPWRLVLLGLGLLLCGLGLACSGSRAYAQDTAEYVGSQQCSTCHPDLSKTHQTSRHALALQDVSSDKTAIKADFSTGADLRMVQIPNETAARAFTADDVAFVVGSGRYVERYLYKVSRNKYALFPAEWNVEKKAWEPYNKGANWPTDPGYDWKQNCAGCHTTGLNPDSGRWVDEGVQCEACHGPGSLHIAAAGAAGDSPSESTLNDIRSAIVLSPDAQICGQCHSQGTEPDGKRPYPVKYQPGANLLDPSIFALVSPTDPDHWWATGHASQMNMQYNEWQKSAHAKSLIVLKNNDKANPACLSCHSADYALNDYLTALQKAGERKGAPPTPVTLDAAKFDVTCINCHNPHSDNKSTKADFFLISDSYTLCTSCHRDNEATPGVHHPVQEMFEGKNIVDNVPGVPSVHFTEANGPRCQTCHMPRVPVETFTLASHTEKPVLPGETNINTDGLKDSCTSCHTDVAPDAMTRFITDSKTNTDRRLKAAYQALKPDSAAWVKTALDFVSGDSSLGIHNSRYTAALLDAVEKELGIVQITQPVVPGTRPVESPETCKDCHQNEYNLWFSSPHAHASLNDTFRKEFANLQQPTYCMGCHASGYDSNTGKYVFEGVVCSNCHYTESSAAHPPAPEVVPTTSDTCGKCHSGAHAPTYDEWLVSTHARFNIGCVACHTSHNNGLRQGAINTTHVLPQGDVNATCGNCHPGVMVDQVHMGDKMTCVDCHMKRQMDTRGVYVVKTGHTMNIDPAVCAGCHGNTHLLSAKAGAPSPEATKEFSDMQAQITQLKDEAQTNWTTGVTGGAIGMLIVIIIGFIILRRGKLI